METEQLQTMLIEGDAEARQQAAEWLSMNVESALPLAVELVQGTGDEDRTVAEYCVATLEEMEPPQESDLPRLASLLSEAKPDVIYWAATLIGSCGPAAAAHAEQLGAVVASEFPTPVRERAVWAIAKIGPAASAARPQLESAADSEPSSLARAVAKALESIES